MKILFILENHYPNIGGVETLFKSLTESLATQGHEITILTNQFSKELKREEVLNQVRIIRVPFRNRYLFTLLGFFPAVKYARQNDIIHTTSYNAGIPAFFAGLITRKKVLITFHEVWNKLWFELPYMNKLVLALHYLFEKFLLLLPFHKFIAVSKSTASNLNAAGISEHKIIQIYNGINYAPFQKYKAIPREKDAPYEFLYFGRLGISKGLDLIMEALKILKEKGADFKLKLIIPSQPHTFNQAIRKTLEDNNTIDYCIIQSDLEKGILLQNIANTDAVIIPSYSEGFCFTAVESMALGKPIISSGKGALSEVVTGQYITMETHSGIGLAEAMGQAMLRDWSQSQAKQFPLEDSINAYLKLYAEIAKSN